MLSYLRKMIWEARRIRCDFERRLPSAPSDRPPVFLVGCGRSGTTLLNILLSRQPGIVGMNEPRDRWFAVDPRTDDIGLYRDGGRLELGEDDVTPDARLASWLISRPLFYAARGLVVEKSPANVFRLPWLRALFPSCRFINLVRDGTEVVTSIVSLVELNDYKIAPARARNQWWGRDNCKRDLVLHRASQMGLLSRDVEDLEDSELNATAAMSEWIMSIETMEFFAGKHGRAGIVGVRYEKVVEDPVGAIRHLLDFMGLGQDFSALAVPGVVEPVESSAADQFDLLSARADSATTKRFVENMGRLGYLN